MIYAIFIDLIFILRNFLDTRDYHYSFNPEKKTYMI